MYFNGSGEMILLNLSEEELYVCNKALEEYRRRQIEQFRDQQIMRTKKFNYGDVVVKKGTSYFDDVFGTGDGEIGIVVGHYECEGTEQHGRDMYRVYYNSRNPYIGADANSIELYTGEVPEQLKNVTWNEIKELRVRLK
jgi:hypothetical protein